MKYPLEQSDTNIKFAPDDRELYEKDPLKLPKVTNLAILTNRFDPLKGYPILAEELRDPEAYDNYPGISLLGNQLS